MPPNGPPARFPILETIGTHRRQIGPMPFVEYGCISVVVDGDSAVAAS